MSLIKCPECGLNISEYADRCPNCGFPTLTTRLRFRIELSGNEDVFSVGLYLIRNKAIVATAYDELEINGGNYEVAFTGPYDRVEFYLREHLIRRSFGLNFGPNDFILGGKYGLFMREKALFGDTPTYACGYSFMHPDFDIGTLSYNEINNPKLLQVKSRNL